MQKTVANQEKHLSIGKAAEHLGVSIDTLRRWEKKGRINSLRSPGGHRYFRISALDNLFGKKYSRDAPTKKRAQIPKLKKHIPIPDSAPLKVTREIAERKTYVVEELTKSLEESSASSPAPRLLDRKETETLITVEDQEKLENILAKPKKKRPKSFKLVIAAVIIFIIIDAIIIYLWISSRTILSPIP